MVTRIHFGTAGWRGVIGDDFTFVNVRRLSAVLAQWLLAHQGSPHVLIGYDSRFLSERFAEQSARVFARWHIPVWFAQRDTPQPAICWGVVQRGASLGLNFTGSHNLPQYSGIKIMDAHGALLSDEIAREIEDRLLQYRNHPMIAMTYDEQWIEMVELKDDYLEQLKRLVPPERLQSELRVVVDPLYGSTREYLESFLTQWTPMTVEPIHSFKDPYFGGYGPEATVENVQELIRFVRDGRFHLGLAMDGDGDRFGIVDMGGVYVQPEQLLCILYDYLLEVRREKGGVVRNVATTHLIDRIARAHGQPVIQTPIGYKYMVTHMQRPDILIAVEESAGFTMRGHIPDKDGMLACLLAVEVVATTGLSLIEYWQEVIRKYGLLYQAKARCACTPDAKQRYQRWQVQLPKTIAGRRVRRHETIDGIKFYFDDDTWLLVRTAGTEPLIRIYSESPRKEIAQQLVQAALRYFQEGS